MFAVIDAKGFVNKNNAPKGISKKFLLILAGIIALFAAGAGFGLYFEYIEVKEVGEAFTSIFIKNLIMKSLVQASVFAVLFMAVFASVIFCICSLQETLYFLVIKNSDVSNTT